jgi:hypothetical protein
LSDTYKKPESFSPHIAFLEKTHIIQDRDTFRAPDKALCSYCNSEFEVVATKGEKTEQGDFRIIAYAANPDEACPKYMKANAT